MLQDGKSTLLTELARRFHSAYKLRLITENELMRFAHFAYSASSASAACFRVQFARIVDSFKPESKPLIINVAAAKLKPTPGIESQICRKAACPLRQACKVMVASHCRHQACADRHLPVDVACGCA